MNTADILQRVPDADPAFVEIVARLPDPPSELRERLFERLPDLHRLFLEKRRASDAGDQQAWNAVVSREVALVGSLE